jgi:hypothetical protein
MATYHTTHHCLFIIDGQKVQTWQRRGENKYKLLRYDGKETYILSADSNEYWNWWKEAIVFGVDDSVDFLVLTNNPEWEENFISENFYNADSNEWELVDVNNILKKIYKDTKIELYEIVDNRTQSSVLIKSGSKKLDFSIISLPEKELLSDEEIEKVPRQLVKRENFLVRSLSRAVQVWTPLPIVKPIVDENLPYESFLARSYEALKYEWLRLEYFLSPGGALRSWFKVNLLLFIFTLVVVPVITIISFVINDLLISIQLIIKNTLITLFWIVLATVTFYVLRLFYGLFKKYIQARKYGYPHSPEISSSYGSHFESNPLKKFVSFFKRKYNDFKRQL